MDYEPIGDELTIEIAAVQAAIALDVSAKFAEQQSDSEGMLKVAEGWMKLSDFLAALRDAEAKLPEKKVTSQVPIGFQPTATIDLTDEELDVIELDEVEDVRDDDCEDGSDESTSCARLHREHGELRIPSGGYLR